MINAKITSKSDREIETWIRHHEEAGLTSAPLYLDLLKDRIRRAQLKHKLVFERSLEHLEQAAIDQVCTSYGALAKASDVEWSKARHLMNGPNGHLDRLLDMCRTQGLPLLTAICVNQSNIADGELGADALAGFADGARRLGFTVSDPLAFHHRCRDECWAWGAARQSSS